MTNSICLLRAGCCPLNYHSVVKNNLAVPSIPESSSGYTRDCTSFPCNAEKNPVTFEAPLKFDRIKAGVFFSVMALLVIAAYFSPHIWQLSSLTVRLMGIANDQEEFVEDVVPKIPAVAALYAAPGFSETARIVLAYRLKREIPFRAMTCEGEYYYLTPGTLGAFCAPNNPTAVSATRKRTLQLVRVSDASR